MTNGEDASDPTADLLTRARAGDGEAFDRLFARALPRLEWFVGLRVGAGLRGRLEPGDVVQETYAAALPLLGDFEPRGEGAFLRWLCAIAANQVRRLAAHHGAQRRAGPAPARPADAALALAADPRSGPCTRAARLEERARVAAAFARLEEDEREVLLQRLVEGRALREVAERMRRPETSLRRLVARACASLGRELDSTRGGRP